MHQFGGDTDQSKYCVADAMEGVVNVVEKQTVYWFIIVIAMTGGIIARR